MKRWTLLLIALAPMQVWANSCAARYEFVNHTAQQITIEWKSFYSPFPLPPPATYDFMPEPTRQAGDLTPLFSQTGRIEVSAGDSTVSFIRQLCDGDLWVNWRIVGPTSATPSTGKSYWLQDYNPIHIR